MIAQVDDTIHVHSLLCKRWSCETCSRLLRRMVIMLAILGEPRIFMTLTWDASRPESPDEAADIMFDAWQRLQAILRRRYHRDLCQHMYVWEATKRGYPHLHILSRLPYVEQRWLSKVWESLTGAPIVYVEAVHGRGEIARYVGKYLGKAPHRFGNHQHYGKTRRWLNTPAAREAAKRWSNDLRFWISHRPISSIRSDLERWCDISPSDDQTSFTARPRAPNYPELERWLRQTALLSLNANGRRTKGGA